MKSSCTGFSLIELMMSLAIGSALIVGAVTVYARSRATFNVNETLARLQENALYALNTLEADLRLAGYWGLTNNARFITGTVDNAPVAIAGGAVKCGVEFPIDLRRPVAASNAAYSLPCPAGPAGSAAQPDSDTLIVRRADIAAVAATGDRLQIYSTRQGAGAVFHSSIAPGPLKTDPVLGSAAEVHDLIARAYYVSRNSSQQTGLPSLRRKNLQGGPSTGPDIEDQEILPGVEDLQIQFATDAGVYLNPGDPALLDAKIVAVKIWIRVRAETPEPGYLNASEYDYADIGSYQPNDACRRLVLSRSFALLAAG